MSGEQNTPRGCGKPLGFSGYLAVVCGLGNLCDECRGNQPKKGSGATEPDESKSVGPAKSASSAEVEARLAEIRASVGLNTANGDVILELLDLAATQAQRIAEVSGLADVQLALMWQRKSQELEAERDAAQAELRMVDEALARRSALADLPDRYSKISRACSEAGKKVAAESQVASLTKERDALEKENVNINNEIDTAEKQVASLREVLERRGHDPMCKLFASLPNRTSLESVGYCSCGFEAILEPTKGVR